MINIQEQAMAANHEYLDLKQAATICSVSEERFDRWIDKGGVPVIEVHDGRLIHILDLVQHLVRHNIPIPDRLLNGSGKKILFVITGETIPYEITIEVIWLLYAMRKETNCVFDLVRFDANIALKIISFCPDKIVLLQENSDNRELVWLFRKLTNNAAPVHNAAPDRIVVLKQFLSE